MLAAIALGLALTVTPTCVPFEVAAVGRSAHGSAIMPAAAPHLLIRALDRLPDWVAGSNAITGARITQLEAAPAINVIPRQATAVVEVSFAADVLDAEEVIAQLSSALGGRVEVERLAASCSPAS